MSFYHLQGNRKSRYWIRDQILPNKASELIGNKIAEAVTISNNDKIVKQDPVEEKNYSTRKKRGNIKQIEKSIIKMEHYRKSKLLNDSTVSKFSTTKNGSK